MSLTYNQAVEQTITAGEQIHQIVNGTSTTEVTVEDGSKVPSIRKALLDNFYFKDPIAWQAGQSENVFNQLRQFTDGSWWYAPSATASNPISMGSTPIGDSLWKIYDFDAIGKLTPQLREVLRRSYAEAGYNIVAGSFENGGTVTTKTDALLFEAEGKAYIWGGTLPKVVPPNSTPATTGGFSNTAWVLPVYGESFASITAAKAVFVGRKEITISNLAYQAIRTYIAPPSFVATGVVDLAKAGQSDNFTYFYDAIGTLYERELEFNPLGNDVMAYTEHWTLDEMNFIFDAMDCGLRGFYLYVDNGVYSQTDPRIKQVVDILLKYNFSVVIGMSCPETGYQTVIDFWADRFDKQNVVGIGFCDEPELKPTQTIAWQKAVIAYIRTKSQKAIYTASVATTGSGRSAVADEIDFILWDYYRQNSTIPDLAVYSYDLSQLEALGGRPGRAIPVIGVYKEPSSQNVTLAQVQKWNQAILDMRPAGADLWAFVFYTRPQLNFENLITSAAYRSILSSCVQYKRSKMGGGFDYATFGITGRASYNVSMDSTVTKEAGTRYFVFNKTNAMYFKLKEPMELCRYALTVSDVSGGGTQALSTFNIQAFTDGAWVTVKSFTHAAQQGNPTFKDGSIGAGTWTAPIGIKSTDYRITAENAYPVLLYKVYESALIFGNPTP